MQVSGVSGGNHSYDHVQWYLCGISEDESFNGTHFTCMLYISVQTDGIIKSVTVFGFQKRYNPEKYYVSNILEKTIRLW